MMPEAFIPSAKAPAWAVTVAASRPYSRPQRPMGSLVDGVATSTRSTTGARFIVAPTSASSLPQVRAEASSCSRGWVDWSIAEGMSEKPEPDMTWTSPPS